MLDRARLAQAADWLAVAVAVSLPWSTSATSILIVLWLLALVPTVTVAELRRELAHARSAFPIILWALGIVGMLWSEAAFADQLYAIKGFHKLLVLPLLFIHFRRSDRGYWVLGGFIISCTVLLAVSWALHIWPVPRWRVSAPSVPVKDYIVQSTEFLIAAFALFHLAIDAWAKRRHRAALAMAVLAILFVANIAFVATGRTSLAAFPVLLLLFGWQRLGWKGPFVLAAGGAVVAIVVWMSSPYLHERVLGVIGEIQRYQTNSAKVCNPDGICSDVSAGYRLEFWKKSIGFVAEAPVLGHGTGSIPILFRRAAVGDTGIAASVTGNPHNLTLEIAVQFGLIGTSLLYALWIAQLVLFRGGGFAAWLGQAIVVQSIVGSLFLSYLLDFSHGWIYVLGVGVLGGMTTVKPS
jgi:O-antigen ligase